VKGKGYPNSQTSSLLENARIYLELGALLFVPLPHGHS
jgi:hypothetical protein